MVRAICLSHLLVLIISICTTAAQKCTNLDCCTTTAEELDNCRGIHSKCPGYYKKASIDVTTCNVCEAGMCRVGRECTCPDRFLRPNGTQVVNWHNSCLKTHGNKWPLSAGIQDFDRRKCAKPPLKMPVYCRNMSCCGATKDQLEKCRGFHSKCPLHYNKTAIRRASCDECEAGMCRVGGECTCPDRFIRSTGTQVATWHRRCAESHGKKWPFSAGKQDKTRRKCTKRVLSDKSPTSRTTDQDKRSSISTPRASESDERNKSLGSSSSSGTNSKNSTE
eukprot:IDg11060t1